MPAFSHFFLKRLSARSKFSSSWIMTSDKFYFPPSWRLCAGLGQTVKLRRHNGMGQAKPSHSFGACASLLPLRHRRCVGGCPLRLRALARWWSDRNRRNQASVARKRRNHTDCRSWVVACEDTLRLPSEISARARSGRSASIARGICSTRLSAPTIPGGSDARRARREGGNHPALRLRR
jgi:hypothetical protein